MSTDKKWSGVVVLGSDKLKLCMHVSDLTNCIVPGQLMWTDERLEWWF